MTAAAKSAQTERGPDARRLLVALLLSFVAHCGLYQALRGTEAPKVPPPEEVVIDVREIEKPPPSPEPQPEPPKPIKAPRLLVKRAPPEPTPVAPPPPNTAPPKEPPKVQVPIRIGVNLDSTVSGGAFAAPVGNSLYGTATPKAPTPSAKPYWAEKFVAPNKVSELPVALGDFSVPYPPEARKAGVEGTVVMLVTIDDQGRVVEVKRVSGPGHGLDEAAIEVLKRARFKPARANGIAVSTQIPWNYVFEIDD